MEVIELRRQDDLSSVENRLHATDSGHIILVLPWDLRFLSRALDFELLRRVAERRKCEIAIVSADPERRDLSRASGFPTFASAEEAQAASEWPSYSTEPTAPPPRHWWDEDVDLTPPPVRRRAPWLKRLQLGSRVTMFVVALLVIAGSAYAIVPSSAVTLVPDGQEFETIVPVSVDPDAEAVDHAARLIPARRVGIEIEGHTEVETTGTAAVVAGRATGMVVFTNLLAQDYMVPAGTVVRTSSTSYPIRFRTTADVMIPAAGQASVPIEALDAGSGNVAPFQINQVEGVAASAVRVINPQGSTGAEIKEAPAVSQPDYDRAYSKLARQLLDQALGEMSDLLEPNEVLFRQSLLIVGIPKQAYSHFIGEQAETVGLDMRIQVRGLAVDVDNAEAIALNVFRARLPEQYELVDATFKLGEVAEEDIGVGWFTFFVTTRGYAAAALDTGEAVDLVRGKRVAEARELLVSEFPLAEDPQVAIWPEGLRRMPLLPLRIDVDVVPKEQPDAAR